MNPVRAGVVGFGFMGQTHVRAYQAAAKEGWPVRLVAVADLSGAALSGQAAARGNIHTGSESRLFDPSEVRTFASVEELLKAGGLDVVSVCTPTHTHVAMATIALRAGVHVLLEKPVATRSAEAGQLIVAERAAGRRVMPAMCMRFWPGWPWLRECVQDGRYGALSALHFTRLGSRPDWSAFYRDNTLCGDAVTDLHVHDVDFLTHLLGFPASVLSAGSTSHLTTLYRFDKGPARGLQVFAEGGWLPSAGRGFRMRYVAEFERATAEFDLSRTPAVQVCIDGRTEGISLPDGTGYDWQVRAFVDWAARGGAADPPATMLQATRVLEIIEAEKRSLASQAIEAVRLVH